MNDDPDQTIVKRGSTDPDETVFSPSSASAPKARGGDEPPVASRFSPSGSPGRQGPDDAAEKSGRIGPGVVINNRFVIEKVLGEGGMGVVYRALDKRKQEAQDRNPYVAVKILSKDFQGHPQAFIALQRETRKSQTLAHPNIITVYDFDRDGETVFMTMEELKGKTLDKLIAEHPGGVEPEWAIQTIKSIAEGLAYAHSKKIVHSDLKPGNVFVTEDNTVKILDFGIARAVSTLSEEAGDKTLFDAKELGGLTPTYASCEMFAGQEPNPSDDIYALGLIGYELLTGTHPYQRTPANLARESGLAAGRVKGIKSYQARALFDSIALEREHRLEDAIRFLSRFDRTPTSTRALIGGAAIAVLVLSPLLVLRSGNQGPEIPFEQLSQEVQVQFTENMASGVEAMGFGDYNGALYFYNEAFALHPRNPDAVEGLQSVVDAVLAAPLSGSDREVASQRLQQVNALLDYAALADNARLQQVRDSLRNELGQQ